MITIDRKTFRKMRGGQLVAGTHEWVHAEQWAAHLAANGGNLAAAHGSFFVPITTVPYALREVATEQEALQRITAHLGGLTPQQVGHSTRYIEFWQQMAQTLGGP